MRCVAIKNAEIMERGITAASAYEENWVYFRQQWTPKSFYDSWCDEDLDDLKYTGHLHGHDDAEPRHAQRKPFGWVQNITLSEEDARA